ncbi:hypothetical protein OEZ86_001487 [Tetradesmus obliquus]|nr:hypothetical protein OEZ86_001487 [Tetradesmus obliquus]
MPLVAPAVAQGTTLEVVPWGVPVVPDLRKRAQTPGAGPLLISCLNFNNSFPADQASPALALQSIYQPSAASRHSASCMQT